MGTHYEFVQHGKLYGRQIVGSGKPAFCGAVVWLYEHYPIKQEIRKLGSSPIAGYPTSFSTFLPSLKQQRTIEIWRLYSRTTCCGYAFKGLGTCVLSQIECWLKLCALSGCLCHRKMFQSIEEVLLDIAQVSLNGHSFMLIMIKVLDLKNRVGIRLEFCGAIYSRC